MKRLAILVVIVSAGVLFAQRPDYEGPTILSRGVGPVLLGGGEFVRLRPYLSVTGIYDTAVTPVSVNQNGEIPQTDIYGVQGTLGVAGYHNWRRTILGLDYRGSYRHYTRHTYFDGSDQALTLGVSHQVSRRVGFSVRQAAGVFARGFGPTAYGGYYDPNFANIPSNELFDSGTYYFTPMADVVFAKSPRLSFNLGGSGVFVRRRSSQLVGVTGGSARGDMSYLVSPSTAIGVDYFFTHYGYTRGFGGSDIHGVAFNYAVRLGRRWHFGLRAGGARVESLGLRRVAVDPLVAAIIGQTTGVETYYRKNYVPQGNVSLSRSFQRLTVSFGYGIDTGYGNGVYLTSKRQTASANLNFSAMKRWSFALSGGYNTFSSLSENLGRYEGYYGGGGVTCQIVKSLHLVSRVDARRYQVQSSNFDRVGMSASIGLAFSPGDLPLSLW